MLALTVRQPYAHAIAHLTKRIENRTWQPNRLRHGDRFAIHAGAGLDDVRIDGIDMALDAVARSAVVAVATFGGIVRDVRDLSAGAFPVQQQRAWWTGPLAWVLLDVVALAKPVACSGARGLWELDEDTLTKVKRQIRVRRGAELRR